MQPLLNIKYDTITIINGLLTPWQDVIFQFFSAAGEWEGESPPLQPHLALESPPPLPHYT